MKNNKTTSKKLSQLANCIRFLSIDAVQKANSGHPGMPMGMADIATVLFKNHLKFDPNDPKWIEFDKQMAFIADNWGNIPSGEKKDENQKSQQSESSSKVLPKQDGSGET